MEKSVTRILNDAERDDAVRNLLLLYRHYRRAWFASSKKKIGDSMFFADPIVWIRYKYEAYQGTNQALVTWQDLVQHSFSHDGICGKRLHWLVAQIAQTGVDILSPEVIPLHTSLDVVATLPCIRSVSCSPEAMAAWTAYEYYVEQGVPKKWSQYHPQ